MIDLRRFVAGLSVVALLTVTPAAAQDETVDSAPFSAEEYLSLFADAVLPGVRQPDPEVIDLFVTITGDEEVDDRIRELAEARGFVRQPLPVVELVRVAGRELQAPAAEAWLALSDDARAAGISLALTSAFRDVAGQRGLFRDRMTGRSDAAIEATLRFSAPPGFSRHHTGYAIDVGSPGSTRAGFINTAAYAWLAADDFAIPRSHGWIPSYPEDGENMGPDPEPWEFVWVGIGRIVCERAPDHPTGFCDVADSPRIDDIAWLREIGVTVGCRPGRYCADDPVTRGDAASFLWRLHGAPEPANEAPFTDVFDSDRFASAVDWLWSEGLVNGTTATSFSPDESLSADDALALLVRITEHDSLPARHGILGPVPDFAGATPNIGELGTSISRAEFASILRVIAIGV